MSILTSTFPVYSIGVTMTEIPNRIAFFIELGECTRKCKGCHSPWLWGETGRMTGWQLLRLAVENTRRGADAIVLMGGTTNGIPYNTLVKLIRLLGRLAPVGLYSGSSDMDSDLDLLEDSELRWLKTGSYREDMGGLDCPTTNQRFYEKVVKYVLDTTDYSVHRNIVIIDKTYLFQQQYKGGNMTNEIT